MVKSRGICTRSREGTILGGEVVGSKAAYNTVGDSSVPF